MPLDSRITLSIRKSGKPSRPVFLFHVFVDQYVVANNLSLVSEQSLLVYDLAQRYSTLFKQRRGPRLARDGQWALGEELFTLWLAPVWKKVLDKVPYGAHTMLVIASNESDVLNLPWELLYLPNIRYMGLSLDYSIRRLPRSSLWSAPQMDGTLVPFVGALPPRPLRVLLMAAAPHDQATLDAEHEERALLDTMSQAGEHIVVEICRMGTCVELRQRIEAFQPHVVHLIGHTVVHNDDTYFIFEDEQGASDMRLARQMGELLFVGTQVQCVIIRGSQPTKLPPMFAVGNLCQGLVGEKYVPIALGWSALASSNITQDFFSTFYASLADGMSLDKALTRARIAIQALCDSQGDPSWSLPALYATTNQPYLFDTNPNHEPVFPEQQSEWQYPMPHMIEGQAKDLVPRKRETQHILPHLRKGNIHTAVITGKKGSGKSVLATTLAHALIDNGYMLLALSNSGAIPLSVPCLLQRLRDAVQEYKLESVNEHLNVKGKSSEDYLQAIEDHLQSYPFVLVLDNVVQTECDESFHSCITNILHRTNGKSRCIITSTDQQWNLLSDDNDQVATVQMNDVSEPMFFHFLLADPLVKQRYISQELSADVMRQLFQITHGQLSFWNQIRCALATIDIAELSICLQSILDSQETAVSAGKEQYCCELFVERLYGELSRDSQQALSRAAVYGIAVPYVGLANVTGESLEKVQAYVPEWQQQALMSVVPAEAWGLSVAQDLCIVDTNVRRWLLDPQRLSQDQRRVAHRRAGIFLVQMIEQQRTNELGISWLECLFEARAQFVFAGDDGTARAVTERITQWCHDHGFQLDEASLSQGVIPDHTAAQHDTTNQAEHRNDGEYAETPGIAKSKVF